MSEPVSEEWQRLSPLTLLTEPVKIVRGAIIPLLAAGVGISSMGGWGLLAIPVSLAVVLGIGLLRWLTTSYRVTGTHLEVRRGLLQRSTLTARLDRVRSVDLEADVVHRVLGTTKAAIGTGVDNSQITLDALGRPEAEALRQALLRRARPEDPAEPEPPQAVEIARLDWSWVRFAPLNLANLAVVLAAIGAIVGQFSDVVDRLVQDPPNEPGGVEALQGLGLVVGTIVVVVVLLALWIAGSCVGYAVRWFGLRVTREPGTDGTTLRRVYGALTHRATTVEEAKVRGATLTTPLLIGLAGGAQLSLLTTGLKDNEPDILPAAPRPIAERIAADVLLEQSAMTAPLVRHGVRTHRRYHFRAQRLAWLLALVAAVVVGVVRRESDVTVPWWLVAVAYLVVSLTAGAEAELRYRRLGHTLTERYLVSRTGSLNTARVALESDGIVGWRIRQSFFDRWRGLAQLTATTAAGPERVTIPDLPLDRAIELATTATPRIFGL